MLVSTILYYVLFTATWASWVFLSPNAGTLSLVRVTQITQLEKVFRLCNFN